MWTRYAKENPGCRPSKLKLLFFDTQTTGLPRDWKTPSREGPVNWPDLVSLAWILMDEDKTILQSQYSIVKPGEWGIPEDSTAIHGITHETAVAHGRPLEEVLDEFWKAHAHADMVVAHNMRFDRNVVWGATRWRTEREPQEWKPMFCTMMDTINLCRLPYPSGKGFKFPKLSELYVHVFKKEPTATLHNSMEDTRILVECFFAIWNPRDLLARLVEEDRIRKDASNQNQTGFGSAYFKGAESQTSLGRRRPARYGEQGSTTLQI